MFGLENPCFIFVVECYINIAITGTLKRRNTAKLFLLFGLFFVSIKKRKEKITVE